MAKGFIKTKEEKWIDENGNAKITLGRFDGEKIMPLVSDNEKEMLEKVVELVCKGVVENED